MSGLVWIASYPKSGNTWMRVLLTNLTSETETPADINQLVTGPQASSRPMFEHLIGTEASDLTDMEIERLRPRAYRQLAATATGTTFHKVHDAWTLTAGGEPLIPPESGRTIYLVRNPLDIAASFAHHLGRKLDRMIDDMADESHTLSATADRLKSHLPQRLLSWSGHVTSWTERCPMAVHLLRYEDLHGAPEASLADVARFVGLEAGPERIARAVRFSAFSEMQAQEQERGFVERRPWADRFFRRGSPGGWREALTSEQAERIIGRHREVMGRFGYPEGIET